MVYFIFDMDETLAELYSVYYFIRALHAYPNQKSMRNKKTAYNKFVEDILQEEVSSKPLGILRPGILDVMKQLNNLYKKNIIKGVIIYSNNGHLESLEFIRDLIHKYLVTDDLIKECIHWNHKMRSEERQLLTNKTWNVLRNIMIEGNCQASTTINPSDVFFFDDLDHIDLQEKLGNNYYKVPAYTFKASFDRISRIYMNAIIETAVNVNMNRITNNVNEIHKYTSNTVNSSTIPPKPDRGIELMFNAIHIVIHNMINNIINRVSQNGGKRRTTRFRKTRKSNKN